MRKLLGFSLAAAAALAALAPTQASAQVYSSLGAGVVEPVSDMGSLYDRGFTVRGQVGLSLVLFDVHAQTGWSRFPGKEITIAGTANSVEDIDTYHAGAGARLGLGFIWAGANALYFFGDGDTGLGIVPEVGAGLGPIEVVADFRLTGDTRWAAVRAGLKF